MNINVSNDGARLIIQLIGNLDGISSEMVTEKLIELIKNDTYITIDMTECLYVSSAGLRTLLTIGKTVKMKGGEMNIVNLNEEVKDVMEMTGFSSIFKGFEGE